MKVQTIFKREEIKFLITDSKRKELMKKLEEIFVPDAYGVSTIYSLYLDTDNYLLARRSMEKPVYKEKLRIRSYGSATESSQTFFEIKKKFKSTTTKRRIALSYSDMKKFLSHTLDSEFNGSEEQILNEINFALNRYQSIKPKVLLTYDREAFYHKDDSNFRITFDKNVRYRTTNLGLDTEAYGESLLPEGTYIMEVKIENSMPLWFAKLLSELSIYKTSFSKYQNAYQRILSNDGLTFFPSTEIAPILARA
ncbi:MAG: polyphosphate polymerase domain-containing protein [Lachnospiraceae bacterium]|nr:polyphosphate polymerase domain-containing protein [Lachnospiraceae bacterium]